ncbi:MAG: penicillin-binding protein activator LpoB [Kiritimatiellae bacterium]|nr:penicillin-binding protein activator LpoB [Kiritimatiellia bacterium]
MKKTILPVLAIALASAAVTGCTTTTRRYASNETRQTVAGFSEEDIDYTASVAVQSILRQDRIKLHDGANRAVTIVEDVTNDTLSRGRDAGALAEALGMSLREALTNSGRVIVYNKEAARYAKIKLEPQYRLAGRLTERNLRQDNGDFQKEYNLNLTLVDLSTGTEFWQKRVHVGKLVDEDNVMN